VSGAIDIFTCNVVRDELQALMDTDHPRVEIDLNAVRYLDSSGICVILSACAKLRRESRALLLRRASEPVLRVLRILKLGVVLGLGPAPEPEPRLPLPTAISQPRKTQLLFARLPLSFASTEIA